MDSTQKCGKKRFIVCYGYSNVEETIFSAEVKTSFKFERFVIYLDDEPQALLSSDFALHKESVVELATWQLTYLAISLRSAKRSMKHIWMNKVLLEIVVK